MTVVLPASLPTPIIGGRWVDDSATGISLVFLSPAVTLASGAEWYLTGGPTGGTQVELLTTDWTGPANATDGSGNPVLVFTVSKINGTGVNRYNSYTYAAGQRDPANRTTVKIISATSSGAVPTNGWNTTKITPSFAFSGSSTQVNLTWNAISGVDFSGTYVVQRALGDSAPATPTTTGYYNPGVLSGSTEAGAKDDARITTGWYAWKETTQTSLPVEVLDSNPNHWTWFRVMAKSNLFGYTGVISSPASSPTWVGVSDDSTKFAVTANPSDAKVVVGDPTGSSGTTATEAAMADPVSAQDLPVETNLPMLANGIGGINHMRAGSRVRWRDGILVLNADQTVSKSHTTRRWGFRFHYNPSTWSQSSAIAQDIDLTTYSQTGGNLLLPTAFSTVDLTVYLNRIVELSTDVDPADPQGIANRAHQLTSGDFNLGSGDGAPQASINPVGLSGSYFDWVANTPLPLTSGYSTVQDKVAEVLKKGTLADLEYLYRAANGDPVAVSHTDGKTADIGMLAMTIMDLYLGPNIKYTVRVANASIQHMMFSNRMIPTFTQVSLSLIRGITMKDSGDFPAGSTSTAMAQYVKPSTTGATP